MKRALLIMMVCFGYVAHAQSTLLSSFQGAAINGKVVLNWTISAGNTCNGIDIFRSVDSTTFELIGDIPGVCGDLSASKSYSFTDHSPEKNMLNYYRLELGSQQYSWIIGVESIDVGASNYLLRPNPASVQTELLFQNDNHLEAHVTILNQLGAIVAELETTSGSLLLDTSQWPTGDYSFQIEKGEEVIRGKVMVVR